MPSEPRSLARSVLEVPPSRIRELADIAMKMMERFRSFLRGGA